MSLYLLQATGKVKKIENKGDKDNNKFLGQFEKTNKTQLFELYFSLNKAKMSQKNRNLFFYCTYNTFRFIITKVS